MKDIRIDNRLQRVFVLRETKDRIVYIPVKTLHRVDYERLREIAERKTSDDMLTVMGEVTLSNGINALLQYDSLICVAIKGEDNTTKILKPGEKAVKALSGEVNNRGKADDSSRTDEVLSRMTDVLEVVSKAVAKEEAKPARRKPGPKPKQKPEEVLEDAVKTSETE